MNAAAGPRVRAYVALGANIGEPVRHLRAAADELHLTPSALSQQIKQLELNNSALERQLGLVRSEVRQFTSRLSELL